MEIEHVYLNMIW